MFGDNKFATLNVLNRKSNFFSIIIHRLISDIFICHVGSFLEHIIVDWFRCRNSIWILDSFGLGIHVKHRGFHVSGNDPGRYVNLLIPFPVYLFLVVLASGWSLHFRQRGIEDSGNASSRCINNLNVILWKGLKWSTLSLTLQGNISCVFARPCNGNSTWWYVLSISRSIHTKCSFTGWFLLNYREIGCWSDGSEGDKFLIQLLHVGADLFMGRLGKHFFVFFMMIKVINSIIWDKICLRTMTHYTYRMNILRVTPSY